MASTPQLFVVKKSLFAICITATVQLIRLTFTTTSRPNPKRSHQLRYVLRNRSTGQVYLVVLFTLYLKEDVNEDGSLKPAALRAAKKASGGQGEKGKPVGDSNEDSFDEEKAIEEARRKLSGVGLDGTEQVNDDDVD